MRPMRPLNEKIFGSYTALLPSSSVAPGALPGLVGGIDSRAHPRIPKHLPHQGAAVRKVRAQEGLSVSPKVLPQQSEEAPLGDGRGAIPGEGVPFNGRGKAQKYMMPVERKGEPAPEPPRGGPALAE